jgi:hypothetical protein
LPCLALPWVNQQLHWYHGKTRGVSHCGLAICIFKAKEKLWKLKYFTMQKYNLQNNPLKEAKVLHDIITV